MKIIYFDIDGTLRDEIYGVSNKTKEMIFRCKEKKIRTILCTGRNLGSIQQDILDLNMDGMIFSGGCCINYHGKVIQNKSFSILTIIRFISVIKNFDIGIVFETEWNIYMNQKAAIIYQQLFDEKTKFINKSQREKVKVQNKFVYEDNMKFFDLKENVYKVCLVGDKNILEQIKIKMQSEIKIVQFIPFEKQWLLECLPIGCDKGKSVETMNQYLGIKKEESMSFGDGENDIDLILATGTGIAMQESSKELIKVASSVCGSINSDGIYWELIKRKVI